MTDARNQDSFDKVLDKVLDEVANRIFAQSQLRLVEEEKVDTGFLLKSGNVQRDFLKKTINYSAPYASFVHEGRLPGTMPPVAPLTLWARRKLGLNAKEAHNAGWAIAMAIKKRGIKPCPFLIEAMLSLNNKQIKVRVVS
jgi:hypothetical protein